MSRVAAILFLFLCCSPLVLAAQMPFQASAAGAELTIIFPKKEAYLYGQPVTFHASVLNASGHPMSNVSTWCLLTIYNGSADHVLRQNMTYDTQEFEGYLNASIMSKLGENPYRILCWTASGGGYASGTFLVTLDGETEPVDLFVLALFVLLPLLLSFLLVFGASLFDSEEHPMIRLAALLGGLVLSFGSLWFMGLVFVKYYDWVGGVDALSTMASVVGALILFFVLYWLLYVIISVLAEVRRKKEGAA